MKKIIIALLVAVFASSAVFAASTLTLSASPYYLEFGTTSENSSKLFSEYGVGASAGFAYNLENGVNLESEMLLTVAFFNDMPSLTEVGVFAKAGYGTSWFGNAIIGLNLQCFDGNYSPVLTFGAEGGYKMVLRDGVKADFSIKGFMSYPKTTTVNYGFYKVVPSVGIEYSL